MTRAEWLELHRIGAGLGIHGMHGNVYLDTPPERALLRRGLIELVPESGHALFRVQRRFCRLTDRGLVRYAQALGETLASYARRSGTRGDKDPKG